MTTQEVLDSRNEKGIISLSNLVAGWYAISRDGVNMISFQNSDEPKFYKNEKSFAIRVSQLLRRGY